MSQGWVNIGNVPYLPDGRLCYDTVVDRRGACRVGRVLFASSRSSVGTFSTHCVHACNPHGATWIADKRAYAPRATSITESRLTSYRCGMLLHSLHPCYPSIRKGCIFFFFNFFSKIISQLGDKCRRFSSRICI